jgi:hypothetical protein
MKRGWAAYTFLIAMSLTACSTQAPNPDGWWDEGVHAVDGYWVTAEAACPGVDTFCQHAIVVAKATFEKNEPESIVTTASIAGYPRCRGSRPNVGCFIFAGLTTPRIVILDLQDGTRRVVTLSCGAFDSGGRFDCMPQRYDFMRVGNKQGSVS